MDDLNTDPFLFHNGRRAHTAQDLLGIIEDGPIELIEDHVQRGRNDFAIWAEHALREPTLAHALRQANDRDSTINALKKWLEPHKIKHEEHERMHRKDFWMGLITGLVAGMLIAAFLRYIL